MRRATTRVPRVPLVTWPTTGHQVLCTQYRLFYAVFSRCAGAKSCFHLRMRLVGMTAYMHAQSTSCGFSYVRHSWHVVPLSRNRCPHARFCMLYYMVRSPAPCVLMRPVPLGTHECTQACAPPGTRIVLRTKSLACDTTQCAHVYACRQARLALSEALVCPKSGAFDKSVRPCKTEP